MIKIDRVGPNHPNGPFRCDWCDSFHKTIYLISTDYDPDAGLGFGRICIWKFLKYAYTCLGKKQNGAGRE